MAFLNVFFLLRQRLFEVDYMLEPTIIPQRRKPRYGFHTHTEKLNGRVAMLSFVVLMVLEAILRHGLLTW